MFNLQVFYKDKILILFTFKYWDRNQEGGVEQVWIINNYSPNTNKLTVFNDVKRRNY